MAKTGVRYLETDVLTEAKARVKHVLETFDSVAVCFSGGKDSLVTLHLVEEVRKELGLQGPLDVIFRDEELIPDDVINFVLSYAAQPERFKFWYYAVQLKSSKFILGKTFDYIQWDIRRKWLRDKPSIAITEPANEVFDQYSMDALAAKPFKGKVAFFTGIRADESLVRFRACVNKKNENYITATESPKVKLVKPIYDWSEKDVFKFFHERGIRYCQVYNNQVWNKQPLRVATPLHAESAKVFDKIRTLYPVFYQQLVELFPEMLVQERYWGEFDRYGIIYQYPRGWNGILQYIRERVEDPAQKKLAVARVMECKRMRENNMAKGQTHNFGGWPIMHVFKAILAGQFKRVIQPTKTPTKEELAYEQQV